MKESNNSEVKNLDKFMENLDKKDIRIPDELEQRIREKGERLKRKGGNGRRIAALAAVFIFAFFSGVKWIPGFAAYAATIPGLGAIVHWMQGDSGTENAKEHGYYEIPGVTVEEDGYTLKIDNIYFDEDRLTLSATASGEAVEKLWKVSEGTPYLSVGSYTFNEPGGTSQMGGHEKERKGKYLDTRAEKTFSEGEVQSFLDRNPQFITLQAAIYTFVDGERKAVKNFEDIRIPFKSEMVMRSKVYHYDYELDTGKGKAEVKKLIISPTRMMVNVEGNMEEGYLLTDLENIYLKDKKGNIYHSEGLISKRSGENQISYYFVPSTYFDDSIHELYLCLDGTRIADKNRSFVVSLREEYPKTIEYMGEKIIINNVWYKDGKLSMRVILPDDGKLNVGSFGIEGVTRQESSSANTPEELVSFYIDQRDEYQIDMQYPGYLIPGHQEIKLDMK